MRRTAHCLNESCGRTWKLEFDIVTPDAPFEDRVYCGQRIKAQRCFRCVKAGRKSNYEMIAIEREIP